ncbi:MAG: phosphatase PAP2 family protein [bacterium]
MPFPEIERAIVEFFVDLPRIVRVGLALFSLLMEYGAIVWFYLFLLAIAGFREWRRRGRAGGLRALSSNVYVEAVLMTIVGLALQGFLNNIVLHTLWNRPRPFQVMQIETLGSIWTTSAFVSGHTLAASVAATILSHYLPDWASEYGIFAFLVGISRLATGMHWPSDVLVAWFLGIGLGFVVLYWKKWMMRRG